jgi:acyl dehydratase
VTNEVVDKYIRATNDATGELESPDNTGCRIAPPMLAAVYVIGALRTKVGPPGGVHAKQQFKFYRPACVGETLYTSAKIVNLYQKKERNYVEMTTETLNQDDDLVTTGLNTRIWGKE